MGTLNVAAQEGNLAILQYFISRGGDPTIGWYEGRNALHYACKGGHLDVVKYLIEDRMMDPSCESEVPPILFAAHCGTLDVVRYLIEEKECDKNITGSILRWAAEGNKVDTVDYLITNRSYNLLASEFTPFHSPSMKGHLKMVKYFIEVQNMDPSLRDKGGYTPLHFAAWVAPLELVKYLLEEKGCDVMSRDNEGDTPLHWACLQGQLSTVKYLIHNRGCDPMVRGGGNTTPLHKACVFGQLGVVRYLVRNRGCDVKALDENGETPFHIAATQCQLNTLQYLIHEKSHMTMMLRYRMKMVQLLYLVRAKEAAWM